MPHAYVLTDRSVPSPGRTVTDSVPVLSAIDGRVERLRTTGTSGPGRAPTPKGGPFALAGRSGAALHAYTLGTTCGNVNSDVALR